MMADIKSVRKSLFSPEKGEKKKKKKKKESMVGIGDPDTSVAPSSNPPPKKDIPMGEKKENLEKEEIQEKIDPPSLQEEIAEMESYVDKLTKSSEEEKRNKSPSNSPIPPGQKEKGVRLTGGVSSTNKWHDKFWCWRFCQEM